MALMPLVEAASRTLFRGAVPGSIAIVQHATLWITFLGASLAARSDRLLALSTSRRLLSERWRDAGRVVTSTLAVGVLSGLVAASVQLVRTDREFGSEVAWGIPLWTVSAIMPLGFAAVAARLIWRAGGTWKLRAVAASGLLLPLVGLAWPAAHLGALAGIVTAVLVVGAVLGMPLFAVIGGAALVLFRMEGTPLSAVPGETYRLATSPMLPAIPLFTLAGYLLAEGGASRRLLRLFSACFGWVPGGLAVVITLLLAFFTPLTGASGVTIVSMGGLLLPMLVKARYPERTSVGLVTVSGSIGLLFPPSLPVILYAYYAELPIESLFLGGLVPGALLVLAVASWGAVAGWRSGAERTPPRLRETAAAAWGAKWELLLPLVVLGGVFGGLLTLVEAAAATVAYALIVECLVLRELSARRDLLRIGVESATLVGGFMIILAVALGLTSFLIVAQVPMHALEWVRAHVESPIVFLLALNLLLIVAGALMDIYSAILVIVPLILPMGAAYGVDPVHLGIIFLANMELGYLMPPMGENLFLAAYRFDRPLGAVYRATLPYVVILLLVVLVITYCPPLTLWLVRTG
jgi:tripartite ATP-independent transporter DctM subunit